MNMNAWQVRNNLRALILLITRTHPMGFRVLLGECPPPEGEEIRQMLAALQDDEDRDGRTPDGQSSQPAAMKLPEAVRLLESEERFNEVVDAVGGWTHINAVCAEWARHYAPTWKILVDHAQWATGGFSRIDEPQLRRIALDNNVSRDTVWRRVKEFPGELARAILIQPL